MVLVHRYGLLGSACGGDDSHVPDGAEVALVPVRYVTEVDFIPRPAAPVSPFTPCGPCAPVEPVAPVFATANENFLFIVTLSTSTGMVASHAEVITAVVINLTVGETVLLFITDAVIPGGHLMFAAVMLIFYQGVLPQNATTSVEHEDPIGAPAVFPINVYASLVNITEYASVTSITVVCAEPLMAILIPPDYKYMQLNYRHH